MAAKAAIFFTMFVDEANIYVKAGDGGHGCVSFRREKFIPKGGPDGGDGGDGGSVILRATDAIDTLTHFAGHHHWRADNGRPGQGKNKTGKSGKPLDIQVPVGTLVYDADSGILLKDLVEVGQSVRVTKGGKGGRGNTAFAASDHQTPREFETGTPGRERDLRLELKLLADVGLVGLPNAGKSTLLSRISAARPKIADYPFTTLDPQLGIVDLPGYRRFLAADLPGLIEGAHGGAGLGDAFLKHIERTRMIVHLVDVVPPDGKPIDHYHLIRRELAAFSEELAAKPELVVVSKIELTGAPEALAEFRAELDADVLAISAVTGEGLSEMLERAWAFVEEAKRASREIGGAEASRDTGRAGARDVQG